MHHLRHSEYTRVVKILGFWICQGCTRFWIQLFMIDIWHYYEYALYSEYARVLNMLRLLMVLSKFSVIDIWHGSEYANVIQGSVQNGPSYMFDRDLSIPWVISMLGHKYARVVNMTRLHRVLCKLHFKDSRYFECVEFWIGQGFKYTTVSKVLNTLGFRICQGSKYTRITHGSEQNASL